MFGLVSLFGKMFGSDKAIDKVMSGLGKAVDSAVFTPQERAHMVAQSQELLVDWAKGTSSGQNLARRFIAMVVVLTWMGMYVVTILVKLAAVWASDQYTDRLSQSSDTINELISGLNPIVAVIITFYFALPAMGQVASTAMNRFLKSDRRAPDG